MDEKPSLRPARRWTGGLPPLDRPALAKAAKAVRWLALRGLFVAGSFLFFLVIMVGAAGWYTSRPQFCSSCHIMEPYYKSWQESSHKDVACIECHFAPGFGGKIRGKMLGLVQLAKYVTASAGPRPSAEVPDASCLRSGCHETRLLSGQVYFGKILFDHRPHLEEIRRDKREKDSPTFKLRCTSCHSQIVQGTHMAVTTSTCFLCHFKDVPFNQGPAACTHCHQIPDKKFDLGGGVRFDHDWASRRGVDCVNCHGDLIRGKGDVPRERCLSCHNRQNDLARIGDVEFMHQKHVSQHKVDCLHCHLQIQHARDLSKIEHAASDCASCHPDHHRRQVEMLRGTGAVSIPADTSAMVTVRAECRTCHRNEERTARGIEWRGSYATCSTCHDEATVRQFESYHVKLQGAIPQLRAALARVRQALAPAKLSAGRAAAFSKELGAIQHDLDFLASANDVHNMHYAVKLNQALAARISALCRELKVPEPKGELPLPKETAN